MEDQKIKNKNSGDQLEWTFEPETMERSSGCSSLITISPSDDCSGLNTTKNQDKEQLYQLRQKSFKVTQIEFGKQEQDILVASYSHDELRCSPVDRLVFISKRRKPGSNTFLSPDRDRDIIQGGGRESRNTFKSSPIWNHHPITPVKGRAFQPAGCREREGCSSAPAHVPINYYSY